MNWRKQTIFVTGATGFIGGRVCERLVQAGASEVRALAHTMHHAARIARLPIELCPGNLLDISSLRTALGNARIVIHCGLGKARGIVRGTENLLAVSAQAGVERFVHISTAAVYGLTPPPGCENEDAPLRHTGDAYCDNKARAERAVLKFGRRGLPAVILRPSIVYGPYSAWSTRLITGLRNRQVGWIDGGNGACNTTYVDNLVDAIFLSLENDQAAGKTFFITDGERVTWRDFIQAHIAMLGLQLELPEISKKDALAHLQQRSGLWMGSAKAAGRALRSRELRTLLLQIPVSQRILSWLWGWLESLSEEKRQRIRARIGVQRIGVPKIGVPRPTSSTTDGRYMPDEVTLATQTATVFFSNARAQAGLGYRPRIPFAEGMGLVEQWLRFANYL